MPLYTSYYGRSNFRTNSIPRAPKAPAAPRIEEAREFVESTCPDLEHAFTFASGGTYGPVMADLADKLRKYGSLSEKQVAFARRLLADHEAAKTAAPAPVGRVEIIGEVLSKKYHPSSYGNVETLKMIVRDDRGFRVWVTVPDSLSFVMDPQNPEEQRTLQAGDRVRLTAELTPSKDDPKFAFGKRPTNAALVVA